MINFGKNNASGEAGVIVAGVQAKATKHKKKLYSRVNYINKVAREIQRAGLQVRSTASNTQAEMLPKVIQYFGDIHIAICIKELNETRKIYFLRKDVIGPDGLFQKGIARHVFIRKRKDLQPAQEQQFLGLGGV